MAALEVPLTDTEKRLIRSLTTGAPAWRRGYCMFCGGFTFGRVCRAHADLVHLDHLEARRVSA
jgi:hypothetical protein